MNRIKTFLVLLLLPGFQLSRSQAVILSDTDDACSGESVLFSLSPNDVLDTLSTILWDFGNGVTSGSATPSEIVYSLPGVYMVSALVNGETLVTKAVDITIHASPAADFQVADSLSGNPYSYSFIPVPQDPAYTYSHVWYFTDTDSSLVGSPGFTFSDKGDYTVKHIISNEYGCSDTLVRGLRVMDYLEVPNVFTPNNDGYNDVFTVKTNGLNSYLFSVYTRSGTLVYRSEAATITWDGRSLSGHEMKNGIYYFTIRQTGGDIADERKGFVHLFR